MSRPLYPLEALRKLRDDRAEAQAQSLAAQIACSGRAEAALREREHARREQEARTAETLRAEHERLARAGGSGSDLLRLAEFEAGARVQSAALAQSEAAARQRLAEERLQEQKLREELSRLEAEAQLVRNHETSFHERHAELQEKADEEAALEQWSARRH
jgi:hypothetical protein